MAGTIVMTIAIVSTVVVTPSMVTVVVSAMVALVQMMHTIAWTEEGTKPRYNFLKLELLTSSLRLYVLPWAKLATIRKNSANDQLFMFDVGC